MIFAIDFFVFLRQIKNKVDMAKPIETTPILEGDDAYNFVAQIENSSEDSAEEKKRVEKGAAFIESLLTFAF